VQDADGTWRCPPGEQAVAPLGGSYRVRTSAEIDWILQRNLRFLEDYLHNDCPAVPAELTTSLREQIPTLHDGTTLATLLTFLPADSVDALYTLIATGQIALDLAAAPLAEPERVVFVPTGHLHPPLPPYDLHRVPPVGTTVLWDGVSKVDPMSSTPRSTIFVRLLSRLNCETLDTWAVAPPAAAPDVARYPHSVFSPSESCISPR